MHKFQGSERDMIIFDSVDCFPKPRAGVLLTNLNGDRLVNAAVTSARGKFINLTETNYMKERDSKKRAMSHLMRYLSDEYETYTRYEIEEVRLLLNQLKVVQCCRNGENTSRYFRCKAQFNNLCP